MIVRRSPILRRPPSVVILVSSPIGDVRRLRISRSIPFLPLEPVLGIRRSSVGVRVSFRAAIAVFEPVFVAVLESVSVIVLGAVLVTVSVVVFRRAAFTGIVDPVVLGPSIVVRRSLRPIVPGSHLVRLSRLRV